MCTVLVLNGVRADYPVVLATNRDEFYARPSSGPLRLLEAPRAAGGRDLVAQGTWMGVTEHGLFVGVTNQRTVTPPDRSKRSRGELVMQALALGERHAIARMLRGVDGREFNAFNLLWGDAEELCVAYAREGLATLEIDVVPPGLHVLPNDRLDSPGFPKVQRARALLAPHLAESFGKLVVALKQTLADRERPALEQIAPLAQGSPLGEELVRELSALCVRTPLYGTRSSTIVALASGRPAHYLYADGPPDATAFVDVMALFGEPHALS
jgi:uncharacterized protein with NRDE domain